MRLRQALKRAGVSQAELARQLGVSSAAVSKWVRGAATLPLDRAKAIETFLDLEDGVLDRDEIRLDWGGPQTSPTMLGSLIVSASADFDGSPAEYVEEIARVAETDASTIRSWCIGSRRLPLNIAGRLAAEFWPGLNPRVFRHEVGVSVSEHEAVLSALSKARRLKGPQTFAQVLESLEDSAEDWRRDPTKPLPYLRADEALNDERNVATAIWDQVLRVAARKGETNE